MPTDEEWAKLIRIVKKMKADYDQSISDLWTAVNDYHGAEAELGDELTDKIEREHRRITRLTKRVEELETD